MPARIRTWWRDLRDSLGFPAALLTVVAALLAFATTWLDGQLDSGRANSGPIFLGGVDGSRAVLSTIAGSTITVAGTVFSITIVALQLTSSQYTPRVLRHFTSDRGNQLVLGVFIATFTYSLLVLRTVHAEADDIATFVPSISVVVAIGLALLSVGFLIHYLHHAAHWIEVAVIVDRAARDTIELIERLFPAGAGEERDVRLDGIMPSEEPARIAAERAGYLQAVDAAALLRLSDGPPLVIRMEPHLGEFVVPGVTLASVWPASVVDEELTRVVRDACVTGSERTLHQDLEFGLRQLADIAVRALSPGVNDPTTATNCIDRLAEVLVVLGNRDLPERVRASENDCVVFVAQRTSFERAVKLAFTQIRHYGAGDPVVAVRLLEALGRIAAQVPVGCRELLRPQAEAVLRAAQAAIDEPLDLEEVAQAAEAALAQTVRAETRHQGGVVRAAVTP